MLLDVMDPHGKVLGSPLETSLNMCAHDAGLAGAGGGLRHQNPIEVLALCLSLLLTEGKIKQNKIAWES